MRTWEQLKYTDTFKDLVDKFNLNSDSSDFIDTTIGTILANGVIYDGTETVEGRLIRPLKPVEVSGIVNSDTIFDNFKLYYRDTNNIKKLNMFPVDLLKYNNGKPQFLYIKEDLTYRVSDYMFGGADEILLARFIINTNSTWNQLYIMGQRAGTPMYNAADEFYDIDGMYIKSPGGLELSQTSGTAKRSGIDFTDRVSPDIYQFYNLASERLPLRYINVYNEVDYTVAPTYNVETNKYMIYNMNKSLKIQAEEYIMNIKNLYYMIEEYSNSVANELHTAIVVGGDQSDLSQMVDAYSNYIDIIYNEVDNLYNLLGDSTLSTVRRAGLLDNKSLITNYIATNLKTATITESNVTAIRNIPCFILNINPMICSIPLEQVLQEVQDGLDKIVFSEGRIESVPAGKFTIQRILWDIYEQTLICQYGDRIYDSFNEAVSGTGILPYPAPFGKTIYIPMAIMIIKSGTTSINDDTESIIIDRRWIEVDQEMSDYADYVARAKADKALTQINGMITGTIVVAKANSLKCTINGNATYKDGDYYLDYNNLRNKIAVINNLTSTSTTDALSAYQGKILNDKFANYLALAGGTMAGTINSQSITPKGNNTYNLGTSSNRWNTFYSNKADITDATINKLTSTTGSITNGTIGTANITTASVTTLSVSGTSTLATANITTAYKGNTSNPYVYSSGASVKDIKAMAKSSADSGWNSIANNTLVFCW